MLNKKALNANLNVTRARLTIFAQFSKAFKQFNNFTENDWNHNVFARETHDKL